MNWLFNVEPILVKSAHTFGMKITDYHYLQQAHIYTYKISLNYKL